MRETMCLECGMTLAGTCSHSKCPRKTRPTETQRQNRAAAEEAAVMSISLAGDNFVDVIVHAIRNSAMSDEEIEMLGNRLGRIPSERARCRF